ncbi:hypothetical protein M409DRAFT_66653 [Zasmidium cellare ATCC 36951]|uniref:ATP-grasp domain-containing protein n=1 Tax=Zasmidium cellare ATCC 36951 TaxID=1080233 RepID=A0A6A6CJA1_ZASCE|nr:uncharacterized protein M409DRAFT_66653 [Zasmidium cellare ATCC 36951]KAF2166683.1 hypothetical protein M409DRAFT_66653 [Zasmidium cellare ATCC 36951]
MANGCSWKAVDIFFKHIDGPPSFIHSGKCHLIRLSIDTVHDGIQPIASDDVGAIQAFQFLIDCLGATSESRMGISVARIVMPSSSGYIVRSDIVPLRMLDCPLITTAKNFSQPLQFFAGNADIPANLQQLLEVIASSAGGILLKNTPSDDLDNQESRIKLLDIELENRLSFPWLSEDKPSRQTLVLVDGGSLSPDQGGCGASLFGAAQALGINTWSHWRKAFIPIDCTMRCEVPFARRIVKGILAYGSHVDGIVTFCDRYKEPVAEAALELGLPTYPPEAYSLALNKFQLGRFEGHPTCLVPSTDLEHAAAIVAEHGLEFPLIVKPCTGFLSEGVFRVENTEQLMAGIKKAVEVDRQDANIAIEAYCGGPEVDANFVLCDGEVLFIEASDEYPKGADVNAHGNVENFIELANVLPSKLPADELAVLRESLLQSLLRLGFRDGFYHLEARVNNSTMEYVMRDGILDLEERPAGNDHKPSVWLIEINPRPPGMHTSEASKHTYGVDYWGLGLLFALEDKQRAKQLSYPFGRGPQCFCEMVFIPVEHGGNFQSGDVCAELFERRPDLKGFVSFSCCFWKKGQIVPDPIHTGVNSWVAHFNVFSRESRAQVLEIAETVRLEQFPGRILQYADV